MREPPLLGSRAAPPSTSSRRPSERSRIDPVELARWIRSHEDRLRDEWLAGVRGRHGSLDGRVSDLLERFFELLVPFLPAFLGPYRDQVQPLWRQAAELYGSFAAMRGLAAGEVIEEFQLLREELLRLFYDAPPDADPGRVGLREVLQVNRVVDLGVTYASVGHTDVLFFALFQGSGVPNDLTERQIQEVHDQLDAIGKEFRDVMELLGE